MGDELVGDDRTYEQLLADYHELEATNRDLAERLQKVRGMLASEIEARKQAERAARLTEQIRDTFPADNPQQPPLHPWCHEKAPPEVEGPGPGPLRGPKEDV